MTWFKVHKAILGARSSVFQTMFDSGMKEVQNGTMRIEDLSPDCVKTLLKYIYTATLHQEWTTVGDELVTAADKYDLPLLYWSF